MNGCKHRIFPIFLHYIVANAIYIFRILLYIETLKPCIPLKKSAKIRFSMREGTLYVSKAGRLPCQTIMPSRESLSPEEIQFEGQIDIDYQAIEHFSDH